MERELIFKGKQKNWRELPKDQWWIKGYYVKCRGHHYILPVFDLDHGFDERYSDWIEVDGETVCQYSGYEDDVKKMIFEGDIVGFIDMTSTESGYCEMDCCGEVGYSKEEACFYVTDRLSAESWEVLGNCHIIGNIFDNQDLLNGEMT